MGIFKEIHLIFTPVTLGMLLNGLLLSFRLAAYILVVSLAVGTVMAVLKTVGRKICDRIVTVYVEIFRNTPILFWILICYIAFPISNQYLRASTGMILVSTAVCCEIVRSGLNAVARGQIEAGESQGLNTWQILWHIVLPQCFQRIVPNFINQTISVFKDTSFLGQVAIPEFLYCARSILGTANKYTGHGISVEDCFIIFGFAAIIYFVINFALSCLLRKLDRKKSALQL